MSTTRDRFSKMVWWQLAETCFARWNLIASSGALLLFVWSVCALLYSMIKGEPTEYQGETLAVIIATALGFSAFVAKLGRSIAEAKQLQATNKPAQVRAATLPYLVMSAIVAVPAAWGLPSLMGAIGAGLVSTTCCTGLLIIVLVASVLLARATYHLKASR